MYIAVIYMKGNLGYDVIDESFRIIFEARWISKWTSIMIIMSSIKHFELVETKQAVMIAIIEIFIFIFSK